MPPCEPTHEARRGCLCDDDAPDRRPSAPPPPRALMELRPHCFQRRNQSQRDALRPRGQLSNEEELMRKIAIGVLAGAGALLTGSANASDIYTSSEYTN